MKTFNLIRIILFLYFVSFTYEDLCPDGEISISALGKCKPIKDFINKEDLTLNMGNLLYLASNNEGKIEKDDYKLEIFKLNDTKLQSHNRKKSKLYIPNSCFEQMERSEEIRLNRDKGIVILVYNNSNINDNNISDIYFIIRHLSENSTKKYISSKTFDFSFCHQDPILFEDEVEVDFLTYNYSSNYTENATVDIDTILYGRKFGIDLFDPYSAFLNDICFKFTSEKGSDVTMDSRLEDYYQNITFCDDKENSHYMSYNYSSEKNTFTYRCAFGYYESNDTKLSNLDKIDRQLKSLVAVSNIKVITCYKQFLNLRDIIKNYGGMICIFVLIIQIVCFLIFCFCGIKPIEEKLNNLFLVGESLLKGLFKMAGKDMNQKDEENKMDDGKPKKLFNLWGKIKLIRQRKLEREMMLQQQLQKNQEQPNNNPHPPKKRKSVNNIENNAINMNDINIEVVDTNEPLQVKKDHKKRKSVNKIEKDAIDMNDINIEIPGNNEHNEVKRDHKKRKSTKRNSKHKHNEEDDNKKEEKNEKEGKRDKKRKSTSKSKKNLFTEPEEGIIKISDYNEDENNKKKEENLDATRINNKNEENIKKVKFATEKTTEKKKDKSSTKSDDEKSEKTQIYEYTPEELNELPLKKAVKHDKRGFCTYYGNILMFSHIILNVFFRQNDYNLFIVKLGLLFMTFPINLTFNILFYTNKSIKLSYVKSMDDISMFWHNIANTIYSSILSSTLLIILKFICLTHNSVKILRKLKDIGFARKKSICVLRCIKIRVSIYFILSLAFLVIFGFYVLCFCAVFENTQKELVKSTFTSWLISLLYPFIICFITSIFRKLALKFKNRILYMIKTMMQFL